MNQQSFRMLANVPQIAFVPDELIERCQTFQQAVNVSRAFSSRNLSDASIADSLGMQASTWSRVLNKPRNRPSYLPETAYRKLCELFGNYGVAQWVAKSVGCQLVPATESRKDRLRRELAQLEAEEVA